MGAQTISAWPAPPPFVTLAAGHVHAWLGSYGGNANGFEGFLAVPERERAARYRCRADRERFVFGRGALRWLLGRYFGVDPRDVELQLGRHGKPFLAAPRNGLDVRLSVSHAGDLVLIGLAAARQVGVDIERLRDGLDLQAIAARVFSPAESARLASLPSAILPDAFFTRWVSTEALLKARGCGWTALEGGIAVEDIASGYTLRQLPVPSGYTAAVATEGTAEALERWSIPSLSNVKD